MDCLLKTAEHVCNNLILPGTDALVITAADHWLTTLTLSPAAAQQFSTTPGVENVLTNVMKDFVSSRPIGVADVASALKMVNDAAVRIVALPGINLTAVQIINALQTVVFIVLQTLLPGADYDILKTILIPAFDLLKTVIVNRKSILASIVTQWRACSCRKMST